MMTNCFSTMVGFGPGWILSLALIVAAVAATYLLTKRQNASIERASTL